MAEEPDTTTNLRWPGDSRTDPKKNPLQNVRAILYVYVVFLSLVKNLLNFKNFIVTAFQKKQGRLILYTFNAGGCCNFWQLSASTDIKFRVLRAQNFYPVLALECQNCSTLPALEVSTNQSPKSLIGQFSPFPPQESQPLSKCKCSYYNHWQ